MRDLHSQPIAVAQHWHAFEQQRVQLLDVQNRLRLYLI
jgi:hypothetical protein